MTMEDGEVNQEMHTPHLVHCQTTLFNFHMQLQLEVVIHFGKG